MSEQDQSLEQVVSEIDDRIAEGDLEAAGARLDEAIESFGEAPLLLAARAEIALENEDYEECVIAADHGLGKVESGPARARLLAYKAYAKFYLDENEQARALFNEAVREDGSLWTAVVGRAMVHEHRGFLHAAMLDLNRAIEHDDSEAQPFAIRGTLFLRTGAMQQAEQDFKQALDIDPDDEESRLHLARIQALAQRTAEAIETLEPLVDDGEDPVYVMPGALLRSQLSLTLGSTEAAAEDARKAIELAPDEPWGFLQLAACHLTAMNPEPGLEALKEAEQRVDDPRDLPDLYALRASAYEQLEKPDKARSMRDQAEGWARLPGVVYGAWLNPAQNVPINPARPVDVRAVLTELFGDPRNAPDGYERAIRQVIDQLPQIIAQNPGVGRIQIELPQVEGMSGPPRSLIIQVGNGQQQNGGQQPQQPAGASRE